MKNLIETMRTSRRVGSCLGSYKVGFRLGWIVLETRDGELSLACLSAVFAWGLKVPSARGVPVLGI